MSGKCAHLLRPFADIPLERVLECSVVVQLKEVCEDPEIVEEEAEGDEAGDEVFQFDAGHPPEQAHHIESEIIGGIGQIFYFSSHHFPEMLVKETGVISLSHSAFSQ